MTYQTLNVDVLDRPAGGIPPKQPIEINKRDKKSSRVATAPRRMIQCLPTMIYDLRKKVDFLQQEIQRLRRKNRQMRNLLAHHKIPRDRTGLYWE